MLSTIWQRFIQHTPHGYWANTGLYIAVIASTKDFNIQLMHSSRTIQFQYDIK